MLGRAPLGAVLGRSWRLLGPRAPQERPKSGLRAALVATWGPPGAQEAPGGLQGAILAPIGGRFRPLRGSIFEASGACCGAFRGASASASAGAGASAKRKRRAKSQGQQAARPQGLKGPAGWAKPLESADHRLR